MILGATASALLNYGSKSAVIASIGFFISALFTMTYSIYKYVRRTLAIREKKTSQYADSFGPNMICACIFASTFTTFIFKYLEH